MLSSPFQQPSRRQNALALQIKEARTTADEALLARLIGQWVHRYGFEGAPGLDLSLPEQPLQVGDRSLHAIDPSGAPAASPLPTSIDEASSLVQEELVEEEVVAAEEELAADEELVEEEVVAAEEELAADEKLVEERASADESELKKSFAAGPVPAPPISTPRSLRRWLPRRDDEAFPKAS